MSQRLREWTDFSDDISRHIENYTVPQYGDKGEDQTTDYTPEDCILQVKKYANRFGRNQREGQQKMDLMKAAHYLCVAAAKLEENDGND